MPRRRQILEMKERLMREAEALSKIRRKKPVVRMSVRKVKGVQKVGKRDIVVPHQVLSAKRGPERTREIRQTLCAFPGFDPSRVGTAQREFHRAVIEDLTVRIESILDDLHFIDPFALLSVTPNFGSPGTHVSVLAHVRLSVLQNCRIRYTRESDGEYVESWVGDATPQGANRYAIDSEVPDIPGSLSDQTFGIEMIEYATYTVEIPDINTPPQVIHIPLRVTNRLAFSWSPGVPVIEHFRINWNENETVVSPGQNVRLSWNVKHVRRIEVKRITSQGPALNVEYPFTDMQDYVNDSISVGVFNGTLPSTARYQLIAENEFGIVSQTVEARLRQDPNISIHSVEVTQSIQRFTLDDTVTILGIDFPSWAWNNSVPLVAYKRTMVRVYIDSGIRNNFNNGAGANNQPNVTGELKVYLAGSTSPLATRSPLNPGNTITARPVNDIDRDEIEHTLNFELPWNLPPLMGHQLEVRVWVDSDVDNVDHKNDADFSRFVDVHDSTSIVFHMQGGLDFVKVRIADDLLGLPAPSDTDYYDTAEGVATRFPAGLNAIGYFIAPDHEEIATTRDLSVGDEWEDLLDDFIDFAGGYENNGEYWTGVVPNEPTYDINGISSGRFFIGQASLPATFAHELAHCYDVGHADCGNPPGLDDRLPAHTGETAVNVHDYEVHAEAVGELMSYCNHAGRSGSNRWPSVVLYEILIDEI